MLNADLIMQEVQNLLLQYPELSEDEQLKLDMLEGATSATDYLRFLVKKVGETQAYKVGTKQYLDTIKARMERLTQQEHIYRELIKRLMDKAEIRNLPLDIATCVVQNGSRKVIVTDETIIPDALMRIYKEPNKTLIKQVIEEGREVPGAQLANGEPHLVIKFK